MRRRFVLLTTIILLLLAVIPIASFAIDEPEFHYIVEDATMTLTGDVTGDIKIPHSWYVRYISDSSQDFKNVEYSGVSGKVAKSMLSNKTTVTPTGDYYFKYSGTITKKLSAPLVVYSNLDSSETAISISDPVSIEFIAFSATKENCFLARVGRSATEVVIGFVYTDYINATPAITVTESANSVNPDLSTGDDVLTPPTTDTTPQSPTNDVLKIILITAVCILSVVVVFLIFKPTKSSKKRDDYYDRD